MHELSIALSLLDVAAEAAAGRGADVVAVHVRVGQMSGVVVDALRSAYEMAREGTPLSSSRLEVEEVPVRVHCPICLGERDVVAIHDLRCAECGMPTPELISGRELDVVALEVA